MFTKVEGIVIRTNDYGETNKVVTLFTKEFGKMGVMARGAKKPKSRLAALSQPFVHGLFLVQQSSGLGTMQQGELLHSHRYIQNDLLKAAYASYIVELTDKLTEEREPNPSLFQLLSLTLQYINDGVDAEILTRIYEIKMLTIAGIAPELSCCTNCGEVESQFVFSFREGGFLCRRCAYLDENAVKMSVAVSKLLKAFYYIDLKRLGNISIKQETRKELKRIITTYYDQYSGVYLKSRKFLEQIHKMEF